MKTAALLLVEHGRQSIPLCRTRRRDVVRQVARAALQDVREAAEGEQDEVLSVLLRQEHVRLERALLALGLGDAEEVPA